MVNNGMTADRNAPDWSGSHYIVLREKSVLLAMRPFVKFFDHLLYLYAEFTRRC